MDSFITIVISVFSLTVSIIALFVKLLEYTELKRLLPYILLKKRKWRLSCHLKEYLRLRQDYINEHMDIYNTKAIDIMKRETRDSISKGGAGSFEHFGGELKCEKVFFKLPSHIQDKRINRKLNKVMYYFRKLEIYADTPLLARIAINNKRYFRDEDFLDILNKISLQLKTQGLETPCIFVERGYKTPEAYVEVVLNFKNEKLSNSVTYYSMELDADAVLILFEWILNHIDYVKEKKNENSRKESEG